MLAFGKWLDSLFSLLAYASFILSLLLDSTDIYVDVSIRHKYVALIC